MDLLQSPVVRAIIKGRELILGATPDNRPRPRGLLAEVQSLGWGVLAEVPGREIVVGAVTKPWEANPTFRALPPDEFAAFREPDYVKIVWTLRADRSVKMNRSFAPKRVRWRRFSLAREVPALLVVCIARHLDDSSSVSAGPEGRG